MGFYLWSVLFVIASSVISSCWARHCYVVAPNVLRIGVEEVVSISGEDLDSNVTVHLYLQDYPGRRHNFSHVTVQLDPETIESVHISVTASDLTYLEVPTLTSKHYVSLIAYSEKWFHQEALILLSFQTGYVYIQTDKPIYAPKQNVKIRVIQLDDEFLPTNNEITIQIRNPQGIAVESKTYNPKKNTANKKNFFSVNFQLPTFPMLGIWSVVALYGYEKALNTSLEFEVSEYVLPTFSVALSTPNIVLPHENFIKGYVEAMYVYGKKVNGSAEFSFSVINEIGNKVKVISVSEKELVNGRASFKIKTEEFKNNKNVGWFNGIHGKRLLTEVTVLDYASGKRETTAEDKTVFSVFPYKISLKRCARDFKPGLVAMIIADISFANGKPASGVPVYLTAEDDHKMPMEVQNPDFVSDEKGRVSFSVNTKLGSHVQSFTATIQTADELYENYNQGNASVTLYKYMSKANAYISLVKHDGTTSIKVGQRFHGIVFTHPSDKIKDIFYVVMSKGKIIVSNRLPTGNFKRHQFEFTVTNYMVPNFRIIAYTIHENELIVDSMRLEVENQCREHSEVILEEKFEFKEPGYAGKIIVHGSKDTLVGILAVDEAVYALRNKGHLTKEKMFEKMKNRDLGCGPGGGSNADMVLANAGIVILTDATAQMRRTVTDCEERIRKISEAFNFIANKYEGRAYLCCKLGLKLDDLDRSCEERKIVVQDFLGDEDHKDDCSKISFNCCSEKKSFLKHVHSVNNGSKVNEEDDRLLYSGLSEADFPDDDVQRDYSQTRVRKDFRESWLFEDFLIGPNEKEERDVTLPHSITTWMFQAVSVSPRFGMCVASPLKVVVKKKVFLQLNLPYSVVRNEQIAVHVTVFNYGLNKLKLKVHMHGHKDLCTGFQDGKWSAGKLIVVDSESAENVVFPLVPLKAGEFNIIVIARSNDGNDVAVRQLYVLPEGETVTKSANIILDPTNQQRREHMHIKQEFYNDTIVELQKMQVTTLAIQPEAKFIPNTESYIISAIGNSYGPAVATSLHDPENMILLPTGCGEQNMMYLAPTLYTMHYLKTTNQITPAIEDKGYNYIQSGYNTELSYRKADGSFAAFPHIASSTWLTAFVMKIFCQAQKLVYIDDEVLSTGLKWLANSQQPDGSFIDDHPVIMEEMMGNVNGQIPMTAFVLIALEECTQVLVEGLDTAKIRATAFLENNIDSIQEPYQLALVTYALAMSESTVGNDANIRLLSLSVYDRETNREYWPGDGSSASIEATSYALLTQLKYNNIKNSVSIVNWLNQQKTPAGSFASTQDTVLAIQSLSEYAIKSYSQIPVNLICNITSSADPHFLRTLHFTGSNALILQELEVNPMGGSLFFITVGTGIAHLSVKMKYNLPYPPEKQCKFQIKIDTTDIIKKEVLQQPSPYIYKENDKKHRILNVSLAYSPGNSAEDKRGNEGVLILSICIKYLGNHDAGMTVIDVGIFTGFRPDEDDLKQMVKDDNSLLQRFEKSKKGLVFYLERTPYQEYTCVQFKIAREYNVSNSQIRTVKVYDYYKLEDSCTAFYDIKFNKFHLVTNCRGHSCLCLEGGCPDKEPFAHLSKISSREGKKAAKKSLLQIACNIDNNYVWRGNVITKKAENNLLYITFLVSNVLKAGIEPKLVLENMERIFVAQSSCTTADLITGNEYIIMGKDGEMTEMKNRTLSYVLDKSTKTFLVEDYELAKDTELLDMFTWLETEMFVKGCDL